ncbi:hypothetical protein NCCP2495_29550 [Dietzia sp. NCCP-2495]|nr:hypothetical protein NCCP2495_29550 [Dietzia sp. NCCP-2495]
MALARVPDVALARVLGGFVDTTAKVGPDSRSGGDKDRSGVDKVDVSAVSSRCEAEQRQGRG